MKISRSTTENMCCGIEDDGGESIMLSGEVIKRVNQFRYLGSVLDEEGSIEKEVSHWIQAGWNNCRAASGILCDRRVPLKLKGKFHKMVVRPAMIHVWHRSCKYEKFGIEQDGCGRN